MSCACLDSGKLGEKLQRSIHGIYYRWGLFVSRKPYLVMAMSTFVAALCYVRLFFPVEAELRSEYLFAPPNSQGFKDMLKYRDTWGSTNIRVNQLYITTKTSGGNVLTADVLKEAQRLDELVNYHLYADKGQTPTAPNGNKQYGRTFGRSDLCYPKYSRPNCLMISAHSNPQPPPPTLCHPLRPR